METTDRNLNRIVENFPFNGEISSIIPLGSGHIHATFRVNGPKDTLILQRFNLKVFPNAHLVSKNIRKVQNYLEKQEYGLEILKIRPTKTGSDYFEGDSQIWRAFENIEGATAFNKVESEEMAFEAAYGFGVFLAALQNFPINDLQTTIPDFHHAPKRWEKLDSLMMRVSGDKILKAEKELDFLTDRREFMEAFYDKFQKGIFPTRVAHNDTKINNVLLDTQSGKARCVIDLDTLMPGSSLFDFGDMVRTFLLKVDEDHPIANEVKIEKSYFFGLSKGFLKAFGAILNKDERENLFDAGRYMCLLIGLRFLTDYFEGNVYYPVQYKTHNLIRAKNQLSVCLQLEQNEKELKSYIFNAP